MQSFKASIVAFNAFRIFSNLSSPSAHIMLEGGPEGELTPASSSQETTWLPAEPSALIVLTSEYG